MFVVPIASPQLHAIISEIDFVWVAINGGKSRAQGGVYS